MTGDEQREQLIAQVGVLDESDARFVASLWHGGQGSALYAFASSGHLDHDLVELEIDRCWDGRLAASLPERAALGALRDWLQKQTKGENE